jgi:hypothetical protein
MKNQIVIDLDTERNGQQIQIGKPNVFKQPDSQEELAKMVMEDIGTVAEALVVLIRNAHQLGIKDESQSMKDVIKHLQDAFVDSEMTVGVTEDFKKLG